MTDTSDDTRPSPYDEPELYDFLFEDLDFDVPFLIATSREGGGPVLEVGCGSGRVLLRLLAAGITAEGLEPSAAMIERLRTKALERGLTLTVTCGDMRDFSLPRRFARVLCPFNAFSHMSTQDDQIAAVRAMYAHVAPGGALVIHQSQLPADAWMGIDGTRVLEHEAPAPTPGHVLRIYDSRTKDRTQQTQHSTVDIEESDAGGRVVRAFRSYATHRWAYRHEFELLLRLAGCDRIEILGDGGAREADSHTTEMWALGWRAPA